MKSEKQKFIILITLLLCFSCTAFYFGNREKASADSEREEIKTESEETATVSNASVSLGADADFFTDYRIFREKEYDETAESLRVVAEDSTRDEQARAEADTALRQLFSKTAAENSIEKILLGRNYDDALFIYNESMPILILKKQALSPMEIADLKKFVGAYLGIGAETVSVFTVWNDVAAP